MGHNILDIDEEDYDAWRWHGAVPRALRRVLRPVWIDDYNRAVLQQASQSAFDFVLVFKGSILKASTVKRLKETGKPVFNFYPDVSFEDHGPHIPAALPWYTCVFTTKAFHGKREVEKFGITDLQHVRHGFDPEVHRPVVASREVAERYQSDVSFVGCWSPEKEERLLFILRQEPQIMLKVFGLGWKYASTEFKQRLGPNLRPGAFGDELALVYGCTKVNLGLLSHSRSDSTLKDQTTARTFQIPASGALMLHEDTREVRSFFAEGREVLLFNGNEDMWGKIQLALKTPSLRESIRLQGYERCMREPYDYSGAAKTIIHYLEGLCRKSREPVKNGYAAGCAAGLAPPEVEL